MTIANQDTDEGSSSLVQDPDREGIGRTYVATGGVRNYVAGKFHDFFCHQDWNIGILEEPIQAFLEEDGRFEIRWFPRPREGTFLADPFGIVKDGRTYIFCEEFDYRAYKGVISGVELPETGPLPRPRVVLDMPFHMSYPYLLEFENEVYCVPETNEARGIFLYRANQLPDRWTRVAALVPGVRGVDPTVLFDQGRWWILSSDRDKGSNGSLSIWYAEDLKGPWRAHARNPVKLGVYGTRPAGTPFRHRGEIYRPAMDCSTTYGRRIILNRIRKLTPTEYEEEPVQVIEPFTKGPYRDGIHTISAFGDRTIVDGLRVTFERVEFGITVRRELRGLLGWLTPLWHKA